MNRTLLYLVVILITDALRDWLSRLWEGVVRAVSKLVLGK